jgi:hypothetical protein
MLGTFFVVVSYFLVFVEKATCRCGSDVRFFVYTPSIYTELHGFCRKLLNGFCVNTARPPSTFSATNHY